MNTAVKTLQQTSFAPIVLSRPLSFQYRIFLWILVFTVLCSAFSLVYIRDISRHLMADFQSLQSTAQTLNTSWSQLLLEQSAWQADARVENIAETRLNMMIPEARFVISVNLRELT
jgi:cell division protein FtsL